MLKAPILLSSLLLALASCQSPEPSAPAINFQPVQAYAPEMEPPMGVEINNYTILSNKVSGGGAISAAQVATLPSKGYTTIINLRFDNDRGVPEEIAAAAAAGLTYVSVPVTGRGFTLEDAKKVSDAVDNSYGHVLLHCGSGTRVSAVWALTRAIKEGLSPEEAKRVAAEEGCRPIPEIMTERVAQELRDARM